MTAEVVSSSFSHHRKERRLSPPFGDGNNPNRLSNFLENILAKCCFAPFPDRMLDTAQVYHLNGQDIERPIRPRFTIKIDHLDELMDTFGLDSHDLELGLSVRSRHLRQYEVLQRWSLDALPPGVYSTRPMRLRDLQSGRGLEFILTVRVTATTARLMNLGLSPGKVLCRKEFLIREPSDSLSFPSDWVDFGRSSRFPSEMLWAIDWHETDDDETRYTRPVAEVLSVLVNSKAESPLIKMATASGSNDLAWKMLAAEIATQIFSDVLANIQDEPEESDNDTLAGQIFTRLQDISGKSYPEIKRLVRQDDSLEELRSLVAETFKVVG